MFADVPVQAQQQHQHHHHHHDWHHHWQPATVDAEFCSGVMEVKMCHARCGHDGPCHKACPMPKDVDLQAKLVEKMECHDKCGDDRECHRACGCPFRQLREKCPMLNMEARVAFLDVYCSSMDRFLRCGSGTECETD